MQTTLQIENGRNNYKLSQASLDNYLVLISRAAINDVARLAIPLIETALEADGPYKIEDVLSELHSGEAQLWLVMEADDVKAIVVTVLNEHPNSKTCLLWLCAGKNRESWVHLIKNIETWAKLQGCDAMVMRGRPGWERVLKDYEKTKIILQKKLR